MKRNIARCARLEHDRGNPSNLEQSRLKIARDWRNITVVPRVRHKNRRGKSHVWLRHTLRVTICILCTIDNIWWHPTTLLASRVTRSLAPKRKCKTYVTRKTSRGFVFNWTGSGVTTTELDVYFTVESRSREKTKCCNKYTRFYRNLQEEHRSSKRTRENSRNCIYKLDRRSRYPSYKLIIKIKIKIYSRRCKVFIYC